MHMFLFLYLMWYIPTVSVWIWTSQKHQKILPGKGSRSTCLLPLSTVHTNLDFYKSHLQTAKHTSTLPTFTQQREDTEQTANARNGEKMKRKAQHSSKPGAGSNEPRVDRRALCLWGKAAAHPSCQKQLCSSLTGGISSPKSVMLCRFRKMLVLPIAFNLVPERQLCRNKELRLQWVTLNTIQQHCTAGKTKNPVSINRTALGKACTVSPVRQHCWDQSWNAASSCWLDFKLK